MNKKRKEREYWKTYKPPNFGNSMIIDFINYANSKDIKAAVLFLDKKKALDKISYSFMIKTLQHFGFGNDFIDWIRIIYTDCSACVKG